MDPTNGCHLIFKEKKNNQQQSTCAPAVLQCWEGSCVGHYPHPEILFAVSKETTPSKQGNMLAARTFPKV